VQPTFSSSRILLPVRPWFIVFSLLAALVLNFLPTSAWPWVPDWVALVLVFWSIREPRRVGMGAQVGAEGERAHVDGAAWAQGAGPVQEQGRVAGVHRRAGVQGGGDVPKARHGALSRAPRWLDPAQDCTGWGGGTSCLERGVRLQFANNNGFYLEHYGRSDSPGRSGPRGDR